jgi:hypothetical protein
MLNTDESCDKMYDWLQANSDKTAGEILEKAVQLMPPDNPSVERIDDVSHAGSAFPECEHNETSITG